MDWATSIPLIVALGGGTGIGLGIKALVDTVLAMRAGVNAREGKRRADIVQQRDEALTAAAAANTRADRYLAERDLADLNNQVHKANESRAREHAADLRVYVMEKFNVRRDELPPWPTMDETIPRAKLLELLKQHEQEGDH